MMMMVMVMMMMMVMVMVMVMTVFNPSLQSKVPPRHLIDPTVNWNAVPGKRAAKKELK